MLLYRLQDKQSKKFFAGIRWYDGRIVWTQTGAFFRTPDSIRKHLEYLIGEYIQRQLDGFPREAYYYHERPKSYRAVTYRNKYRTPGRIWKRIYPSKLKLYRVVINDVLVKGEKFVPAKNFMERKQKQ